MDLKLRIKKARAEPLKKIGKYRIDHSPENKLNGITERFLGKYRIDHSPEKN